MGFSISRFRGSVLLHRLFYLASFLSSVFTLFILLLLFSPQAFATTYVSGTISQNTTWTTAGSPYVLYGNVTVAAGYTLTIEPDVVVKPQTTASALTVNGTLTAQGAVFTSYKDDAHGGDTNGDGASTSPAAGNWRNISVATGGSATISSCTILYGGYYYANYSEVYVSGGSLSISGSTVGSSQTAGIYVNSGTASIINNTVSDNQGSTAVYSSTRLAALYGNTISNNPNAMAVAIPATLGQGAVYSNSYSGNKNNAMFLNGNAVSATTTWPASNSPYVLAGGNVTINAGYSLDIESGAVVKFATTSTSLSVNGTLSASGVVFTSYKDDSYGGDTNADGSATSPEPGNWRNISIATGGSASFNNCSFLYGGYYYGNYGEIYVSGGSLNISGSTVSSSQTAGIYVNSGTASITDNTISANQGSSGITSTTPPTALHGNTISDNPNAMAMFIAANMGRGAVYDNTYSGNKNNALFLYGASTISTNTTWPASNSPYVIGANGIVTVSNNAVLSIDPGVVVKLGAGTSWNCLQVNAGSTLNADGAVFTSYKDDASAGDTNGDGPATTPAPGNWGYIYFNGSTGTLSNSIIRYGGGSSVFTAEIYMDSGASPTLTGNAISNSLRSGIHIQSASPSVHNNDIFTNANGYYGLYSSSAIDASFNWWGGVGGPKPFGTGNAVSSYVTAVPWSDVPFTQAGAEAQAMGTDTWCGAYGEPVNTSTGAFVYSHRDIEIPTNGLPLSFERTYNSNDRGDGPLGYGWSHNWQMSANPRLNGDVVILRGDGRKDTFVKNPDNSYTAPSGRHDTLVKNANGTYSLTTCEQVTYNFNAENRLSSLVSETGQSTSLTYDANKRLITITEPAGRTLSLAYNAANRIDHITDPQNQVSFGYSASGDLTSVTDQNLGVTNFALDSYHHITSITDPNGHTFVNNVYDAQGKVDNQTDADGNLITFDYSVPGQTSMTTHMDPNDPSKDETTVHYYDSALRLTKETDPYGKDTLYSYDAQGNRDTVTDRRGVVTHQVYDSAGNITDVYKAQGLAEEEHTHFTFNARNHPLAKTDARGYTTSYTYDASGSYLNQISYPQVSNYDGTFSSFSESFTYNADGTLATSSDRNGDVTAYTYDAYGNPDQVNKNTNRATEDQVNLNYDFDSLGRKTSFSDGTGKTTTYEYNDIGDLRYVRGQVTNPDTGLPEDVVTEYQYDANGNKTAVIDPEGKTTSYSYTNMDNLSQVTDARLNTIQHTYDAAYNRTATKDRNCNWTHFGYDKNNRLTSATDPEENTTSYSLDEEGNRTAITDPLSHTVTQTFDGLGRLTSTSEPDEGNTTRTTSYGYDAAGNLTATTDPGNQTYTQNYDELSRLKSASDPLSNTTYHRYDGEGNRIKSKDPRSSETSFSYSPNDMLTSVTDPLSSTTAYAYDKNGNRTSQTDAESHTTLYAYDELNRLTNEKVDAGGGNWLLERSYRYDKAGNLAKDITGEGEISYTRDDVYNVTTVTDRQSATFSFTYDNNQNQLTAVEDSTNRTVSFGYDSRGLISGSTDAHGAIEVFTYDGAGNLTQRDDTIAGQNFTTTFDHTPRNQVKTVTRGTDTSSFTYDPAGRLSSKSYANGVNTSFTYDNAGRPTALSAVKDGQTLQSFVQSFDGAGNITGLNDGGTLTGYTYDSVNRLTDEDIGGYGEVTYTYDRAGNRLTSNNPTTGLTTYSYNEANQLTQTVNGADTTDFSYNSNGAITQKEEGLDITTYAYNGLDKLTEVTTPSTTVDYSYDATGRRISRAEGTSSSNYHHNAKSDLTDYETDAAGNLTAAYNRGPDGLISQTDLTGTPVTSYNLYNPHGDTSALTDETGAITASYRYDSFGNPISGNPTENGYTGKWQRERDDSTGTIRMGVREYDPALGRFVSADPLKGDPTNPQQRNRYPYVGNNPTTIYDLNGMWWGGDAWGWLEEKASAVVDFTHRPEFALFTGYIPPEKRPFADNQYVQVLNDPSVQMGLAIGIGIPGAEFGELGGEAGLGARGTVGSRAVSCTGKTASDFFKGTKYSPEALEKMEIGDYHAFPQIIDSFQDAGTVTEITGNDGVIREMLRIPGNINGVEGEYEYIKEPDGTISHRFFNPNPN